MPSIVIFYATESKQIRGVLVPESDEELQTLNPKAPKGESLLVVPAFENPNGMYDPANNQYVIDYVTQATGVIPPDPSCVVVNDKGVVEGIIAADATLDILPDKVLVQKYNPDIAIGCTYNEKSGEFTVPAKIVPSKIGIKGEEILAKIVPAKPLSRD